MASKEGNMLDWVSSALNKSSCNADPGKSTSPFFSNSVVELRDAFFCYVSDATKSLSTTLDTAAGTVKGKMNSFFENTDTKRKTEELKAKYNQRREHFSRPASDTQRHSTDDWVILETTRKISSTMAAPKFSTPPARTRSEGRHCEDWLYSLPEHVQPGVCRKKSNSLSTTLYNCQEAPKPTRKFVKAHSDVSKLLSDQRKASLQMKFTHGKLSSSKFSEVIDTQFLRSVSQADTFQSTDTVFESSVEEKQIDDEPPPKSIKSNGNKKHEVAFPVIKEYCESKDLKKERISPPATHTVSIVSRPKICSNIKADELALCQKVLKAKSVTNKAGNICASLQFLIITGRLKVSIHSVDILTNDGSSKDLYPYYVKVSLNCSLPKIKRQRKCTKTVTGSQRVSFDQDIFFKNITFENVHSMTVKFQLFVRKSRFGLRRFVSVAERSVNLENVDVVVRANINEALETPCKT